MPVERINPKDMADPTGIVHIVKDKNTAYISGQVGRKPDGTLAGLDIRTQTQQVFENLKLALAAVHAGFEDITKTTIYLTDRTDLEGFREVRNQYLTGELPASTLAFVLGLADPDMKVEVEATVAIPG